MIPDDWRKPSRTLAQISFGAADEIANRRQGAFWRVGHDGMSAIVEPLELHQMGGKGGRNVGLALDRMHRIVLAAHHERRTLDAAELGQQVEAEALAAWPREPLHDGRPVHRAAREVRVGDMLRITTEGGEFEVQVRGLSDIRGPASEAQKLYQETEASKDARARAAAERRAAREFEILPAGRPSKRDRRRIIQFRGRG